MSARCVRIPELLQLLLLGESRDHMVWLAEAYRARYAAQPHSLCGSVSLVAINFNANLRKIHPGTSTQLNSAHFDLHIRASAFQFSWRSVYAMAEDQGIECSDRELREKERQK